MINLAPSGLTAASGQEEGGSIPGLIFDTVEVVGDGGNRSRDNSLGRLMSNDFMVTNEEITEKTYHVKGNQENAEHKGNHVDPERETGNVLRF